MSKIKLDGSSSFDNLCRVYKNLDRSLSTPVSEPRDLSGIIKDFEMVYELSWKVLKKRLLMDGHQTQGARDVFAKSYQLGFINDQSAWLEMIDDRNNAAHVYDESSAQKIVDRIRGKYHQVFARTFDV